MVLIVLDHSLVLDSSRCQSDQWRRVLMPVGKTNGRVSMQIDRSNRQSKGHRVLSILC
jgi:hypothetical protein